MGFFRRLTDSSFKVDSAGRSIFYPWGIFGKGYVLPDKEYEEKIRSFLTKCYAFNLITIMVLGAFLGLWSVLFWMVPFVVLIVQIQSIRFKEGLQSSDVSLSFKENIRRMFTRSGSNKSLDKDPP